jgi:hypothetical protein
MPIIVEIGDKKFLEKLKSPKIQLLEALEDIADFIYDAAVAKAPGSTKQAIDVDIEDVAGRRTQVVVGLKRFPKHAVFVHEGTGIFGDRRRPIQAPPGQAFAMPSGRGMLFRTRTMGQRPQPFMDEAVELAQSSYIPLRVIRLGAELT